MKEAVEIVVVVLPAEAVRFAEACAGGKAISRVIESGLELLSKRLTEMDGADETRMNPH